MNHIYTRLALRFAGNAVCRAFSAGLVLGLVFWLICSLHPGDAFRSAMALLLLLSGSGSYLMYAVATSPETDDAVRISNVRYWIVALSLGVVLSIHGFDWLLG